MSGLAKAGRGLADFVGDEAKGNLSLQTVVVRQLAKALEPALRKPQIECVFFSLFFVFSGFNNFARWIGCKPDRCIPASLPAIVGGERIVLYAQDVKLLSSDATQIGANVTGIAPGECDCVVSLLLLFPLCRLFAFFAKGCFSPFDRNNHFQTRGLEGNFGLSRRSGNRRGTAQGLCFLFCLFL